MKPEHAEEYTQALGQIVAGGWRQIALGEQLGVPKALKLSTREWVEKRLGGYVKLSVEERHGAAADAALGGFSNRKKAEILGVDEKTLRRDAANAAPEPIDTIAELAVTNESKAAKNKQAKRREREDALREQRRAQEEQARAEISALDAPYELVVADIQSWRPEGVASIITDPPYVGDSIPLYEKLRDFAVDVLPDGGPLVVMTWQAILPDVVDALSHPELAYRWMICWRYANVENTVDQKRRVFDCWKPILVYHKGAMPKEAPMLRDEIANAQGDKDFHEWGQSLAGFSRLIESFSLPGEVVCDPFLGGGTTAMAALSQTRRFVGCDVDIEAVETTRGRLAA